MKNTPQESNDSSVRAIIRDSEGRHLLLRRSKMSRRFPGMWEWPGGKCGAVEGVREALRREVQEETGLQIEVLGEFGVYLQEIDGDVFPQMCYDVRVVSGSVRLSPEHEKA